MALAVAATEICVRKEATGYSHSTKMPVCMN
jgi:hypothetical protein